MEDLAAHGDAGDHLCWREIHPKLLLENIHLFSKTLTSNHIDSIL
jgi:hypothetical protein